VTASPEGRGDCLPFFLDIWRLLMQTPYVVSASVCACAAYNFLCRLCWVVAGLVASFCFFPVVTVLMLMVLLFHCLFFLLFPLVFFFLRLTLLRLIPLMTKAAVFPHSRRRPQMAQVRQGTQTKENTKAKQHVLSSLSLSCWFFELLPFSVFSLFPSPVLRR
jgi:hypothetical protein